jgi:hypothetical protein
VSLDAQIRAIVTEAVVDATKRAARSKECMNAKEAREFLGLTEDEWKKRRHRIPRREESERKSYYLREDLLAYLRSLPLFPKESTSDYLLDYGQQPSAPYDADQGRISA